MLYVRTMEDYRKAIALKARLLNQLRTRGLTVYDVSIYNALSDRIREFERGARYGHNAEVSYDAYTKDVEGD